MFKFELECLLSLRRFADESYIYIPKPLDLITVQKQSLLFLEWIDLNQSQQKLLGKGLALLHQASTEELNKNFGWESEGFIGSSEQLKGWDSNWGNFFVNFRLIPQLRKAEKWGIRVNDYKNDLLSISSFLNKHCPVPSLIHGDLWSGNCGSNEHGLGSIFDPACYWADREVDISMTKLFGGFNRDFYEGYEEVWPTEKFSEKRTNIYNLYHLLNHANIFGGSYKASARKILKNLGSYC